MGIFVVLSSVSGRISLTTQNKFGWHALSTPGVQSKYRTDHLNPVIVNTCLLFARCDARPDNLDRPGSHRRSHVKTDFLINTWDPGILWDQFGVRSDIVVCSDVAPFIYFLLMVCISLLHVIFLEPTSMNSSPRISCTNL